ncbi:hypothetical protein EC12741_4920 [Escherichia coli 1.2741]|nr:hypothetical protein EC12741_4920 [Escherichia coli 1.2741]
MPTFLPTIATHTQVDYNNRLSVRTVYSNDESPDFQATTSINNKD